MAGYGDTKTYECMAPENSSPKPWADSITPQGSTILDSLESHSLTNFLLVVRRHSVVWTNLRQRGNAGGCLAPNVSLCATVDPGSNDVEQGIQDVKAYIQTLCSIRLDQT